MNELMNRFDGDMVADMLKVRNAMFDCMPMDDEWPDRVDDLTVRLADEFELSDDDAYVAADELMQLEW